METTSLHFSTVLMRSEPETLPFSGFFPWYTKEFIAQVELNTLKYCMTLEKGWRRQGYFGGPQGFNYFSSETVLLEDSFTALPPRTARSMDFGDPFFTLSEAAGLLLRAMLFFRHHGYNAGAGLTQETLPSHLHPLPAPTYELSSITCKAACRRLSRSFSILRRLLKASLQRLCHYC